MKCLGYSLLDLKTFLRHSAVGAGRCPLDPVGTFVIITTERACKSFKPAPAAIVVARVTWAAKL